MKLASYKDGSRDGQLVVVSRDLASAHYATGIATRLQQVLDDWNFLSPQLEALSHSLDHGRSRHPFAFDPACCLAPLPRAFQWVDGQGRAGGPGGPGEVVAALRRGAGDHFLAPLDSVDVDGHGALAVEPKLAVIVGDVAAGVAPGSAVEGVRLVLLAADLVERHAGAWPGTAFSPVAATPDELGASWRGGRLTLALEVGRNGSRPGVVAAADGQPHFGALIAEAASRRGLSAGSIVGGGAFRPADAVADALRPGDRLRIDMKGLDGRSLFGAIELRAAGGPATDAMPALG